MPLPTRFEFQEDRSQRLNRVAALAERLSRRAASAEIDAQRVYVQHVCFASVEQAEAAGVDLLALYQRSKMFEQRAQRALARRRYVVEKFGH